MGGPHPFRNHCVLRTRSAQHGRPSLHPTWLCRRKGGVPRYRCRQGRASFMDRPMKVALVTGGAHGIGAAIAARLARDGWRVVVADLDPNGAAPPGGRYVVCDVADETAVSALLGDLAAREARLDALVCNAGINVRKPIAQLTLAEWS